MSEKNKDFIDYSTLWNETEEVSTEVAEVGTQLQIEIENGSAYILDIGSYKTIEAEFVELESIKIPAENNAPIKTDDIEMAKYEKE